MVSLDMHEPETTRLLLGWSGDIFDPSASSRLDFRVEAFEFDAGFVEGELPINTALFGVNGI